MTLATPGQHSVLTEPTGRTRRLRRLANRREAAVLALEAARLRLAAVEAEIAELPADEPKDPA